MSEEDNFQINIRDSYGFVAVNRGVVIQQFLTGISTLPTNYSGYIENFLTEYLGTADRPTPFGGRAEALQALDEWLNDSESPPYMLLATPAGRGKSALLVHWCSTLFSNPNWKVAFIPVSIRFGLSSAHVVFTAALAHVARVYGEEVSNISALPAEVLQSMLRDYLGREPPDGRQLLLILDGIDEAADWKLGPHSFPLKPTKGVRILVSARQTAGQSDADGWLRTLGWNSERRAGRVDLTPLSMTGVCEVLERLGFRTSETQADVNLVNELYRLSAGDPLLVRLYADTLRPGPQGEPSSFEALHSIRPGLEGYVEFLNDWWSDQQELWDPQRSGNSPLRDPLVAEFLGCLSNALGPLSVDDVVQLMPPELRITTFSLDGALRPLSRLVVGDGVRQGYTFNHPLMTAYFRERHLNDQGRHQWDERFISWGQREVDHLIAGDRKAEDVSRYLVQHYGAHLDRYGARVEDLLFILTDSWHRAWESLEFGHSGYLSDIDRVRRAAERVDQEAIASGGIAEHLTVVVSCALYSSSINGLYAGLKSNLVLELVSHGYWSNTQALAVARMLGPGLEKAVLLLNLSSSFNGPEQEQILLEGITSAEAIDDHFTRARILLSCVEFLTGINRQRVILSAYAAARDETRQSLRGALLLEIAPYMTDLSPESLRAEGLETIFSDPETIIKTKVTALGLVADQLSDEERNQAYGAICAIEDLSERIRASAVLAEGVPDFDNDLFTKQLAEVRNVKSPAERAEALLVLNPYLPESMRLTVAHEALDAIKNVEDLRSRSIQAVRAATYLPQHERETVIENVVAQLWGAFFFGHEKEFLDLLIERGYLSQALQVARSLHGIDLVKSLVQLVPWLEGEEQHEAASEAFSIITGELLTGGRRGKLNNALFFDTAIDLLVELNTYVPESNYKEALLQALEVSKSHWDEEQIVGALQALAQHQNPTMRDQTLQAALNVAEEIIDPKTRAEGLSELSKNLLRAPDRERAIQGTLAAARSIDDPEETASMLIRQIPSLPWSVRTQVLEEALVSARAIKDVHAHATALIHLIPYLSNPQLYRVRAEAEDLINHMDVSQHVRFYTLLAATDADGEPRRLINKAQNAARNIGLSQAGLAGELLDYRIQLAALYGYTTEAIKAARKLEDAFQRAFLLEGIARNTSDVIRRRGILREVLDIEQSLTNIFQRLWLLTGVIPLQSKWDRDETVPLALDLTTSVTDPLLRAAIRLNLAKYSSKEECRRIIEDSFELASGAEETGDWTSAIGHPFAYTFLLKDDPSELVGARNFVMLNELNILGIVMGIKEPKAIILKAAIKLHGDYAREKLIKFWHSTLNEESNSARSTVLNLIGEDASVIKLLGGEKCLPRVVAAIQETRAIWK